MLYALCILIANTMAPLPFKKPPNVVMVFFPLCAATTVSSTFLLAELRPAWRPVPATLAALALSWVVTDALFGRDCFLTRTDLLEVGDAVPNDRVVLEEDMADIGGLLSYASRQGGGSALTCGVTLREDGRKAWLEDAVPMIRYSPSLDAADLILEPQAFFSGTRILWKKFSLANRSEDSLWVREEGKPARPAALRTDGRHDYVLLTVVHLPADKRKLWDKPDERTLLRAIRSKNARVYRKLFAGSTLLTSRRLHRNLFLYAFRLPAKTPAPA
jgi:hypothetical protein